MFDWLFKKQKETNLERSTGKPEDPLDASIRKSREKLDRIFIEEREAAQDMLIALRERQIAMLRRYTQEIREGKISLELREYLQNFYQKDKPNSESGGSSDLSPDLEKALLDILERTSKENPPDEASDQKDEKKD